MSNRIETKRWKWCLISLAIIAALVIVGLSYNCFMRAL